MWHLKRKQRSLALFSFLQDIRLLNAGKPAQHTAEVERELDKGEGEIRLLFNDVQLLKDGHHPQAEQMYRRWVRSNTFKLTYETICYKTVHKLLKSKTKHKLNRQK